MNLTHFGAFITQFVIWLDTAKFKFTFFLNEEPTLIQVSLLTILETIFGVQVLVALCKVIENFNRGVNET